MNQLVKYIIVLIIGVILGYFLSNKVNPCNNESIYIHDTVTTIHIDTVYPEKQKVTFKTKPIKPIDSILIIINKVDSNICNYKRTYSDSLSTKEVTVYYTDTIIGKIVSKEISYRLKVPLIINRVETIEITNTIEDKIKLYGGLELEVSPKLGKTQLFIQADLKKFSIGYGYNLSNSSHNIILGRLLFKK